MKKIYILIGMAFMSLVVFGIAQLNGNSRVEALTTTTTYLTTIPATTTITVDDGNYYYFDNYEDLVSQIYDDIYNEVYQNLYDEIVNDLDTEFYEQIYAQVEQEISDLLSESEIQVYVDDFQQQLYDVIDLAEMSVLGITSYNVPANEASLGSGVVYKYDSINDLYYIVTNYHVVEDGTEFEIYFSDESTTEATLLGVDTEVDIAVLTFSGTDLSVDVAVSTLGDSDAANVGEFILAVGNPIGYNFYNSVNLGIIAGLDREVEENGYIDYIQHDASINSGNSGGPIYNLDGEVIGINVSKYASIDIEGMGFSIPINLVKDVIEAIESGAMTINTIMPRIGATLYDVSELYSSGSITVNYIYVNGIKRDNITITLPTGVTEGLVVAQVEANRTLAGILDGGDLLVQIDDYQITDYFSFREYVYEHYHAGDTATIQYYAFNVNDGNYEANITSATITFN